MRILWTDGSASPNPGPGGFAVIEDGKPVALGKEDDTTNIRMEGSALIAALDLSNGEEVEIHTDSEFWLNVLTKWAENWEQNGWKKKGGEIKNLEMVQELYAKYKASKAKLVWVRGHVGTEMNEIADEWANKARKGATI
ncbi:ribonuclease HI [Candidatus Saccharibacteria bacterium]|nr:ribonuclease HI [Candidatus Saccharibacteria bacterium]